jgi:hypothetical protein
MASDMKIILTEEQVKTEHPLEYANILNQAAKKNLTMNGGEWSYSYGMLIGHKPDNNSLEDTIEHVKKTMSASLIYKEGRKQVYVRLNFSVYLPSKFREIAETIYDQETKAITLAANKQANFDAILKTSGVHEGFVDNTEDTPAFMNIGMMMAHMTARKSTRYPRLEELKDSHPEVYAAYQAKADGTKLFIFNPDNQDADEWGFTSEDIQLATRRNDEVRFIYDNGYFYVIEGEYATWSGYLSGVEKAFEAKEGEDFKGWKKTNQYRLTQAEIEQHIKGKVFKNGNISF